jgi:hypothetical protein
MDRLGDARSPVVEYGNAAETVIWSRVTLNPYLMLSLSDPREHRLNCRWNTVGRTV